MILGPCFYTLICCSQKSVIMVDGAVSSVTRSCSPLGVCVGLNTAGNGVYCCDGDRCNSGERLYFSATFLLLGLLRYVV